MEINGIEFLGVELTFDGNSKQEIKDFKNTFDFGTLRLSKGDKELVLDGAQSKAVNYTIFVDLEKHTMLESKNDLLSIYDLDVAEFYIGSEYEIQPDYMTLITKQNGCIVCTELQID